MTNEMETKSKKPIWKKWWFWVIAVFVILIIASAGGEPSQPVSEKGPQPTETKQIQPIEETPPKVTEAPQKTTPTKEATWQKVKSWKGTGIKNTEPFKISGKQWRIIWSNEDTSGFNASVLQIFVYKPNGTAPLQSVANVQGTASDTSYIYKSGEFYLNINSANSNWTLVVEELK